MPFAISEEPEVDDEEEVPELVPATKHSVISSSGGVIGGGSDHRSMMRAAMARASPTAVQGHFREALSSYLKAMSMIKGAVSACQRVSSELSGARSGGVGVAENSSPGGGAEENLNSLVALGRRCEVSQSWLMGQFTAALERADASNSEIARLQTLINAQQQQQQRQTKGGKGGTQTMVLSTSPSTDRASSAVLTVEELIYDHSLLCGRDGALKQLLGQLDAARSCYRSAGLLAETLLMESKMGEEDRAVLEEYVHSFAERIVDLDSGLMQNNQIGVISGGSGGRGGQGQFTDVRGQGQEGQFGGAGGSRKSPGIAGLVI